MIYDFVSSNANKLTDPHNLALIGFETQIPERELLNQYYKDLKSKWVNEFYVIDLVETDTVLTAPKDLYFFDLDLLQDDNYFEAIYMLVSSFWPKSIPAKHVTHKWTEIVKSWEDTSLDFITIEKLVGKINDASKLDTLNEEELYQFYEYLIRQKRFDLFENFKLLPNLKGDFIKKGDLKRAINIDVYYLDIADIIVPEVSQKIVKSNFESGLEFDSYNRKKLSEEINTKVIALTKDLIVEKNMTLDDSVRNALISLCSIFPSEKASSVRKELMPYLCIFYGVDYSEKIIENIEDERFDYDYTPFRGLVKNFLLDIIKASKADATWIINMSGFLKTVLDKIFSNKELKEVVEQLPVFPNQNYTLCRLSDLRREINFPSDQEDSELLKRIYKDVIEDIKKELILPEFAEFVGEGNEKAGIELSGKLEQRFREKGTFEEITEHPYKRIILEIIEKITDSKEWEELFPNISEKKAIVMMAKISNQSVRNDLFSIIGLEDKKIALLGKLSKNKDIARIIELGQIAVEMENRANSDFEFLKRIGVHIENLVRERIKDSVDSFSIEVLEQQDGQDMVVKVNGKTLYYIEVKSRWDINSSTTMSTNQIKNAVRNKNCYSLCSVDMTNFNPENINKFEVKDIATILDRIKFVNDIGTRIEPLIANAITAEGSDANVKLSPDYRVLVPQPLISSVGQSMDVFVNHLVDILGLKNNEHA